MAELPLGSISEHFGQLENPRIERNKLHPLLNIIMIPICAVISGTENWVDVPLYGLKKECLAKYLDLSNGVPSHNTFGRVFRRLKAEAFQACFLAWVKAVNTITGGQVIVIDGKELRRSMDTMLGKRAIHMVSAWASENRLVLAQQKVDKKSNEITAIPVLLEMLEIAECIITIDSRGCQTEIAQQITDQQGEYVLAVKENQGHLKISSIFASCTCSTSSLCSTSTIMPKRLTRTMIASISANAGPWIPLFMAPASVIWTSEPRSKRS